jgi:hypothetical protein
MNFTGLIQILNQRNVSIVTIYVYKWKHPNFAEETCIKFNNDLFC